MLLGDSGVGKTCAVIQFKDGAFLSGTFLATVGIDFRNKVVTVDGVQVKLQIWDTAGQERFRSVTHAYYRDAQALLLLYDITSRTSFDNIRAWLTEIHEYAQKDVVIMLLGNKCDMNHERVIRPEDGETLAKEYGVPFMETSAKTGMNVDLAFLAVANGALQVLGGGAGPDHLSIMAIMHIFSTFLAGSALPHLFGGHCPTFSAPRTPGLGTEAASWTVPE